MRASKRTDKMFSSQSPEHRDMIRDLVDMHDASIESYGGNGFSLALPADWENLTALVKLLTKLGWNERDGSRHYFPLGTDNPAAHLRHNFYKYQRPSDDPGYWMFAHFE
jgi:hypothetical protein